MQRLSRILATHVVVLCVSSLDATEHRVPADSSQAVLQSAIDAAAAGDVIVLEPGNYVLSKPLTFKSGVSLEGPLRGLAMLDASALKEPLFVKLDRLNDLAFRRLDLRNVSMIVSGIVVHESGKNITFDSCWFRNTRRLKGESTRFIQATYATGLQIKNCVFLRDAKHHGIGIHLWRTHHSVVENCRFGEAGTEYPAESFGHFKSAIAVNGNGKPEQGDNVRSVDVVLKNNTLRRSSRADAEEDHGIYVMGARNVTLENNDIAGWTIELTGGAIKVRDGENYVIRGNTCTDSGILLYNYVTCAYHFDNVVVADNTIRIPRWDEAIAAYRATGISYWRNDDAGHERSVRIENNRIENGVLVVHAPVNVAEWNADGGGVRDNTADAIVLVDGIAAADNRPRLADWKMPPLPAKPAPAPLAPLDATRLAENEGLVDGVNAGVLRLKTKAALLRITLKETKVLDADGEELVGRDILRNIAVRGTPMLFIATDGKVTEVRLKGNR